MSFEDLDSYQPAYQESFEFHQENLAMLRWYADRIASSVCRREASSLLSLGIGYQTVNRALLERLGPELDRYVIVEGSQAILDQFRGDLEPPANLSLVHGRFEEFTSGARFDAIEMGFVLEHVADPAALVRRYRDLLAPGGRIYVAVPNARSLHRMLGHHAGMLDDVFALSDADRALGHKRYFDAGSLEELLTGAGLTVVAREGVFLKPFSTRQLAALGLAPEVLRALYQMGIHYPEICNAIFMETRASDG